MDNTGTGFRAWGGYLDATYINNFSIWFLQLYFIAVIVFRLLLNLREKSRKGFAAIFICLAVSVLPFQRVLPGRPAFHINALPAVLLFMYLGFWSKDLIQAVERRPDRWIDRIKWGCLLLGVIIAYYFPGNIAHIGTLFYVAGACGTVMGFYLIVHDWNSRFFLYLGKNSLYILGLHTPVSALFRNYAEGRILGRWDGPLMNFLFVGGIIAGCSMLIWFWNKISSCKVWRNKSNEKAG